MTATKLMKKKYKQQANIGYIDRVRIVQPTSWAWVDQVNKLYRHRQGNILESKNITFGLWPADFRKKTRLGCFEQNKGLPLNRKRRLREIAKTKENNKH